MPPSRLWPTETISPTKNPGRSQGGTDALGVGVDATGSVATTTALQGNDETQHEDEQIDVGQIHPQCP